MASTVELLCNINQSQKKVDPHKPSLKDLVNQADLKLDAIQ